MAWTYEDPSQSPKDAVRFAVGDTDSKRPQLQDGEIVYCLSQRSGDIQAAAVMACEAIIAQLGRLCDQSVGSVAKSFSQLQANYKVTLDNLRRSASGSGGIPFVGGVSRLQNGMPYRNPDYNRPQFTTKMMEGRRGTGWATPLGSLTASRAQDEGEGND